MGTITRGNTIIDIMNAMEYDIAVPGNHDFDYSVKEFLALAEKANFTYVSCNFNKEGEPVFKPYVIREFDGVEIGFVGVCTPDTLRTSTPSYFMDENGRYVYTFMQDKTGEKLYAAVQKAVDDARAEGARYVVVLAHLGNEAECAPWRFNDVISHTSGINVLLDGHGHDYEKVVMKNKDGEDVIRQACGTKLDNIGVLTINPDGSMDTVLLGWDKNAPAAPQLMGLKNPGLDALEWSVHSLPREFGGFDQVSGITFEVNVAIESPVIKDENGMFTGVDASKERRVRNVLVGGTPLDPEKTYTLASIDYQLQRFGDGYTMYEGAKVLQQSVKLDNQLLIDYIQGTLNGVVGEEYSNPYGQGRIVIIGAEE